MLQKLTLQKSIFQLFNGMHTIENSIRWEIQKLISFKTN